MKKNFFKVLIFMICSLPMLVIVSCSLPKGMKEADTLEQATKFTYVPDSTQSQVEVPVWRDFFHDSLLVSLIDTALKKNIDLRVATQRIFQAQSGMNFNRNAYFPDLNAVGSVGTTQYGQYTENGVGNFDTNKSPNITSEQQIPNPVPDMFVGARTNWEIGFAGKLRNRKKAAYYKFLASQNGKQFTQTQLVASVGRLYYELLALDNQLKIIRKNLRLQERAMEIVEVQKQGGQINELAVKQFRVQLLQSRSLEAGKIQQIVSIENNLNILLGRYPQSIERADTLLMTNEMELLTTGLPAQLIKNRPDIIEAEQQLHANEAQLKAVRASFFPSINLSGFLAFNSFNPTYFFNPASTAFQVSGVVTAPLLNRRGIMRDYWIQGSEKNIAFLQYQKMVYTGVGEVSTYYNRVLAFRQMSELKEQEVSELTLATGIATDLFLTGYATYLEVLTVRRNVLEAEIQLTDVRKEFYYAEIDLYKSLGGGWK